MIVIAELDSHIAKLLVSKGESQESYCVMNLHFLPRNFTKMQSNIVLTIKQEFYFKESLKNTFPGFTYYYPNRYPSFSNDDIPKDIIPWEERNKLVMVVSNKYYRNAFNLKAILSPKGFEAWLRGKFKILQIP